MLPFMAALYSADSIGTNHSAYKIVRRRLVLERSRAPGMIRVCLFFRCGIHQYNLVRRAVVKHFDSLWANLVRLGHLFQSSAFKRRFRAALNYVLLHKFDYMRLVGPVPPEVIEWQNRRSSFLREHGDGLSPKKIFKLCRIDNGDRSSDRFGHICIGCCQSKMDAFEKMYVAFAECLVKGFPTPLLYGSTTNPQKLMCNVVSTCTACFRRRSELCGMAEVPISRT